MTKSRLRMRTPGEHAFGRAKNSAWTNFLLITLRCYALTAVSIAVYAFFRSLH